MQLSKNFLPFLLALSLVFVYGCVEVSEKTAKEEQERTELNQKALNEKQPAPRSNYSIERENLINRFRMMNDQSVVFYLYVFNEGVSQPVYRVIVNKVSSVNSQLTNPMQIVPNNETNLGTYGFNTLPSPAEDGSYGTNGEAVFGFSPDLIYTETNMNYIATTVPINFVPIAEVQFNVSELEDYTKFVDGILSNN